MAVARYTLAVDRDRRIKKDGENWCREPGSSKPISRVVFK